MPKRTPSYRLHKPTGKAVVTLDGKDHYLGKFDSAESRENYHRLIAEWLGSSKTAVSETSKTNASTLTVVEMIAAFWDHAQGHYRHADGQPSEELGNFKAALRPLRELYGKSLAHDFGPLALRAVRSRMVDADLARTSINARVNRIRRVFRWAASVELVPVGVVHSLETVAGLQQGRTSAREPEPIGPVPLEVVEQTLPFLSRPVAAMVRLQLLTGMRASSEVATSSPARRTGPTNPSGTSRPGGARSESSRSGRKPKPSFPSS